MRINPSEWFVPRDLWNNFEQVIASIRWLEQQEPVADLKDAEGSFEPHFVQNMLDIVQLPPLGYEGPVGNPSYVLERALRAGFYKPVRYLLVMMPPSSLDDVSTFLAHATTPHSALPLLMAGADPCHNRSATLLHACLRRDRYPRMIDFWLGRDVPVTAGVVSAAISKGDTVLLRRMLSLLPTPLTEADTLMLERCLVLTLKMSQGETIRELLRYGINPYLVGFENIFRYMNKQTETCWLIAKRMAERTGQNMSKHKEALLESGNWLWHDLELALRKGWTKKLVERVYLTLCTTEGVDLIDIMHRQLSDRLDMKMHKCLGLRLAVDHKSLKVAMYLQEKHGLYRKDCCSCELLPKDTPCTFEKQRRTKLIY